jgi:glycosyltransferase involved in cell wall biosynthesis
VRILYVHQFFATRESSLGLIRSYEFARRWVEDGHEVTMITSASRLPEKFSADRFVDGEIDGIHVRAVRVPYSNYMGPAQRIRSFLTFMFGATRLAITAGKHDVVFATSTPLTAGVPGLIASRWHATPFIFEVRDLWPEAAIQMGVIKRHGLLGIVAKSLERMLYHRARFIVALSPGIAAGVIAEGIGPERVCMVPNSSDLDLFSPGAKDSELVERYGLAGKFVVGYAGAIGPSNDVEGNVPKAARILLDRGRDDIVFLIAGDGKSKPALEEMTEPLGNVKLVGSVPKAEVPRLTRTADTLLVLFADKPILATNSPNKFFDGLATGRPMIVNSPGWTRQLVEDHDAGAYFPAGDGAALADVLERLADDPASVARMGANARTLAESCFARDILAEQVLALLEATTLLHAPPPALETDTQDDVAQPDTPKSAGNAQTDVREQDEEPDR